MKESVKVAAVQMDVRGLDPETNLAHMSDLIHKVMAEDRVDLIVFPELANSGYVTPMDVSFARQFVGLAEKVPGPFTGALGELARRYGVYIVTGMLEAHPVIPLLVYNSAVLIAPSGETVGVHRKMHLPGEEKHYFGQGSTIEVHSTELGGIGIAVCADASFPELPRTLALKGAEIVCSCYNVPKTAGKEFMKDRIWQIAACRSIENMCFFVGCDRVGSDARGAYIGCSAVTGPMGQTLARSEGDTEEVLRATLTREMLEEARVSYGYFTMRRPEYYSRICEPTL